jgi:hypothetical protein
VDLPRVNDKDSMRPNWITPFGWSRSISLVPTRASISKSYG